MCLQNIPGATFIQRATLIPESRVTGQGLFLAISYRKPALIQGCRTSLENTNLDALFESHFSLGFTFLLCRFINVSYVMEFLA